MVQRADVLSFKAPDRIQSRGDRDLPIERTLHHTKSFPVFLVSFYNIFNNIKAFQADK